MSIHATRHVSRTTFWFVDSTRSSSRMRVMNHNWSDTKQRLHPQSVAEISRHSVLSGERIRHCIRRVVTFLITASSSYNTLTYLLTYLLTYNVEHRLCLATKTQISVCKSPFPSAGTAVSLFRAKTVQQRPLLPREVETRLPDCGIAQ